MTAGTIFDRTWTPLTVWFTACWLFATQKDGISAQSLHRSLEIGSYPTAWAMLHRLRSVLVRPGRDRLTGTVEVDETFIGGQEPGLRGGRARGKKVLTGIAVEAGTPKGIGRCRMAVLEDASAESLNPFVTGAVEPDSIVITDGWQGYSGLEGLGYTRERRSQRAARARGEDPGELLPPCTASLPWPSDGCWAPTRARWTRPTCPLPQRIRLPLQPAPLTQPRPALLPGAGAGHGARSGSLPRPPGQQAAAPSPCSTGLGSSAKPGPPSGQPALEDGRPPAAATDLTPVK